MKTIKMMGEFFLLLDLDEGMVQYVELCVDIGHSFPCWHAVRWGCAVVVAVVVEVIRRGRSLA